MNTKLSINDTDLASRRSAATLRSEVEACLHANNIVVLDLSVVQSLSESYADELFGVLVQHYTLPWVFSRLQVTGAKPAVVRSITQAIRYRLENTRPANTGPVACVVREAVERHEETFATA